MSIEQNKAVNYRIFEEIWGERNFALVDELIDADYVQHGDGTNEYKGREDFRQFIKSFIDGFPDLSVKLEDVIAEGDKVVSRVTISGTHQGNFKRIAPTGKEFVIAGIFIIRYAGGKAIEAWLVKDQLLMMLQMGVINAK